MDAVDAIQIVLLVAYVAYHARERLRRELAVVLLFVVSPSFRADVGALWREATMVQQPPPPSMTSFSFSDVVHDAAGAFDELVAVHLARQRQRRQWQYDR